MDSEKAKVNQFYSGEKLDRERIDPKLDESEMGDFLIRSNACRNTRINFCD